ncbi:MAG TPA: hypothetical protein VMR95_01855, partial [Candidatus Binatia bacterium]|nr:hypothetical protein [Candidatus Binatia bacterium]
AAGLWHGKRTRRLRQQLESDRMTEEGLEAAWDDIKPIKYVSHLAGVPTEVYLGAKDIHIPYKHGQKMANAMEEAGAKLKLRSYDYLGHYTVSLAYYLGVLPGSRQSTGTTK